jgi:hypothetical protein
MAEEAELRIGKIRGIQAASDDLWIDLKPKEDYPAPPRGFYRLNNPSSTMAGLVFMVSMHQLDITIKVGKYVSDSQHPEQWEYAIMRIEVTGLHK